MMERNQQPSGSTRAFARYSGARGLAVAAFAVFGAAMLAPTAHAQSTSTKIYGQAPAGFTVVARSSNGFTRHTTVHDNGKYYLRHLPLGVYDVTLKHDGKKVDMYHHVPLTVSRGALLNFACPKDECAKPDGSQSS